MIRPIRHPGPSAHPRRTPTHRVIRRAADRTNDRHPPSPAPPDGTEETRTFFLHNLRGDLVATLDTDGAPQEEIRYTPYGVPILLSLGDTDGDGLANADDVLAISGNLGSTTLDDEDLDRDGEVDLDDYNLALNVWWGVSDERGALTRGDGDFHAHSGQRKGYAAYEHTFFDDEVMHVRHRVYLAELGRFNSRGGVHSSYSMDRHSVDFVGASFAAHSLSPDFAIDGSGDLPTPVNFACALAKLCLISSATSCLALCSYDPVWDDRGDDWGDCMVKCLAALYDLRDMRTVQICVFSLLVCNIARAPSDISRGIRLPIRLGGRGFGRGRGPSVRPARDRPFLKPAPGSYRRPPGGGIKRWFPGRFVP